MRNGAGVDGGSRGMAPLSTARATSASALAPNTANEMHETDGASISTTRVSTATATPASTDAATATTTDACIASRSSEAIATATAAWHKTAGVRGGRSSHAIAIPATTAAPAGGSAAQSATAAPVGTAATADTDVGTLRPPSADTAKGSKRDATTATTETGSTRTRKVVPPGRSRLPPRIRLAGRLQERLP